MAQPFVQIVPPTGVDVALLVHENLTENFRRGRPSDLQLPSLYQRALLLVGETTEIAVIRKTTEE